jgi:hypothetical protein
MTEEIAPAGVDLPHETAAVLEPVPVVGTVSLTGRVPTTEEAADFGTYRTITLLGTEEKQQILPYDKHRVRATILVSGTGPVWVGSEAQCAAVRSGNTAGGGALLATGQSLPVGHKQSLWLVGNGVNTATVVIAQERMAT